MRADGMQDIWIVQTVSGIVVRNPGFSRVCSQQSRIGKKEVTFYLLWFFFRLLWHI